MGDDRGVVGGDDTIARALGSMTRYVRDALPGIMAGIREGYEARTLKWGAERDRARTFAQGEAAYAHGELVLGAVPGRRTDWIDVLDRIQKELTILAFGPALIIGRIVLLAYAPFRAIPIKQIQDVAALKSADNILTRGSASCPTSSTTRYSRPTCEPGS